MDDTEGGLSFDFEGNLDNLPTIPTASNPVLQPDPNVAPSSGPTSAPAPFDPASTQSQGHGNRRSFRQTVCRHWLRSLCMKGDSCGFLHQYDKSRMPVCRFFRMYGECREQDCVYKHTNEDIKECNMYKLGFCPNGPDCRYRHAKQPGPPPPVEEVLQKIQQLTSYNYSASNKFFQQRNSNFSQQADRSQFPQGAISANQAAVSKPTASESNIQQQPIQAGQDQTQNPASNLSNQPGGTATPLPQGITRYFIVKSCNRENLELSVQQGVWATQRSNEAKLNEAFDSVEHVILIFSVNRTRHFQGCAKMTSKIGETASGGNWKHAHGTAHYGRNFSVKWLKLCELSFNKTRHLRNPYNENLPVKISRDCQELEPSVGEQLASLLYLEPDGELMATLTAAESKREEEKAKGLNVENEAGNPDIVPFEDNEEEEEEDSEEEEDDSVSQVPGLPGLALQGRGRGRGMMWPPNFPMGRGIRPMPGLRGFPPGMMGADGFSYGPGPDGFPMPDPFGMAPRPFVPYGPRFPNDFANPAPGMMFPGRPSQPGGVLPGGGFGMMMGPGRGPFIPGGMGMGGRGGRPMGMPPMFPPPPGPPQGANRGPKRDMRGSNDWGETFGTGPEQGKQQDMGGGRSDEPQGQQGVEKYVSTNKNDESESEDEAPRRSRHGEGKKKRRSLDGDVDADP
ncbi:30-kDa cleavage and polyadenylation specificity factor 30 isoform X1 [Amaranthus tricolor]|uniref:30-kDa cleavage and polyadenylation specificity factor 30 isoform X1 n=1 Tax=Amaranthus tricolor TaxID=29722 RepID=UPI00258AA6E9|nr:30-kDa cleavage and polyadenylation specificity factor 30 isoform X1 [Amaranthus tricolor]